MNWRHSIWREEDNNRESERGERGGIETQPEAKTFSGGVFYIFQNNRKRNNKKKFCVYFISAFT